MEQSGCWYFSVPANNRVPHSLADRGLPQEMVVTELPLQVILCSLPLDSTLVLQTNVLVSGHRHTTLVLEPVTGRGGRVATVACLQFWGSDFAWIFTALAPGTVLHLTFSVMSFMVEQLPIF